MSQVKVKTSRTEALAEYLNRNEIRYQKTEDCLNIYSKDTHEIIDILTAFKESILDFEATKGSLNDVFLKVTGREIRE